MKHWNNKTYYYCPANHKFSHWHMHKVEDCNMYKKEMKEKEQDKKTNSSQVTVDSDKLKKGMAALVPSGDFDTNNLADALSTTLANLE